MSITLHDVCNQFESLAFPSSDERRHPTLEAVKGARAYVEQAIASECFMLDCVEHEIALIEAGLLGSGLVPFFVHPTTGIRFSFGYWSPGASPGPHVHTAWTLTALCKNQLNVITYDTQLAIEQGELVVQKDIDAMQGQVGFIHDVCIHNPTNNSSQWSWTLHITSPLDGERSDQFPSDDFGFESAPLVNNEHPYREVLNARQRISRSRYLDAILSEMSSTRAKTLKARCGQLGAQSMRNFKQASLLSDACKMASSSHKLALVNKALKLSCKRLDSSVALTIDTGGGVLTAVEMDSVAEPALAYVTKQDELEIQNLPGNISRQEQYLIGETLENVGLFRSLV